MSSRTRIRAFLKDGIRRVHLPSSRKARLASIAFAAMAAADATVFIGGAALSAYNPSWTQQVVRASPRAELRSLMIEAGKKAAPRSVSGDFGAILLTYHDVLQAEDANRGTRMANLFDIGPDQWIRMLREHGKQAGLTGELARVDLGEDGSINSTTAEDVAVLFDLLRDDRIVAQVFARWLSAEIDRSTSLEGYAPAPGGIAALALAGCATKRDAASLQGRMEQALRNPPRDEVVSEPPGDPEILSLREARADPARLAETVNQIVVEEGLDERFATALLAVSSVGSNDQVRDHLYGLSADGWIESLMDFGLTKEVQASLAGVRYAPERFTAASGRDAARILSTREDVVLATRVMARRLASESVEFEKKTSRAATAKDLFSVHFFGGRRAAGYFLEPAGAPMANALLAHTTLAAEALAKADELRAAASPRMIGRLP
ncbi:hypothetical protein ACVIGB_000744 [Bradyrhizobium sp. USDA 4341]